MICLGLGSRGNYTAAHWSNLHVRTRGGAERGRVLPTQRFSSQQSNLTKRRSDVFSSTHSFLPSPRQAAYAHELRDPGYDPWTVFCGLDTRREPTCSRMVCVDAKGSVRRELPDDNDHDHYLIDTSVELWEGGIADMSCSAPRRPPQDDTRRLYFGDFMGVKPGKLHVLSTLTRWTSEETAWSVRGERCPVHPDEMEGLEDSVRMLAEKSDSLAGFMTMVEDTGVWGNVASCMLQEIQDDYRGKTTFLFATREQFGGDGTEGEEQGRQSRALLAEGLAVASLAPLVDMYVPIVGRGGASTSGSVDDMFRSSLIGAVGIFGATAPLMTTSSEPTTPTTSSAVFDMAALAGGIGHGHHQCPLATLDVFSPALDSPVALSRHAREDPGRITEHISVLGGCGDEYKKLLSGEGVLLSHPSTRTISRIPAGVPRVRGMNEAGWSIPAGEASVSCASVIGSTTAFAPELRSLAGLFEPRRARNRSALLESWGVQGLGEEVHEALLTMADCLSS